MAVGLTGGDKQKKCYWKEGTGPDFFLTRSCEDFVKRKETRKIKRKMFTLGD